MKKDFFYLSQISRGQGSNDISQAWLSEIDLGIPEEMQVEWRSYITGLKSSGFMLSEKEDTLLWSWKSKNGEISAKMDYDALFYDMRDFQKKWWHKSLWK